MFLILFWGIVVKTVGFCHGQIRCCMPPQWESPIGITEGFYSPSMDSSGEVEGVDKISYDYPNKRVAGTLTMRPDGGGVTNVKSITDFKRKKQYTITDGHCSMSDLGGESALREWECVPENATYSGKSYYGAGNHKLLFESWNYEINGMQVSMSFTVSSCLPVSEAVIGRISSSVDGIVLVSYTGLTLGIRDERVFVPPSNCSHTGQTIDVGGSGTVGSVVGRMKRHVLQRRRRSQT